MRQGLLLDFQTYFSDSDPKVLPLHHFFVSVEAFSTRNGAHVNSCINLATASGRAVIVLKGHLDESISKFDLDSP